MRENWGVRVVGRGVELVPYRAAHVPTYHAWMAGEELQRLTGSLPLSMEEELAMQEEWRRDPAKCTFIVLSRERLGEGASEVEAMVGDTNLFLGEVEEEEGESRVAEAEIMIAEEGARGKGLGREAMLLMLRSSIPTIPAIPAILAIPTIPSTSTFPTTKS